LPLTFILLAVEEPGTSLADGPSVPAGKTDETRSRSQGYGYLLIARIRRMSEEVASELDVGQRP
jgi:hypothetical protein